MPSVAAAECDDQGSQNPWVMVGNYRLLKLIGKGAYATVYLALHTQTFATVALKLIPKTAVSKTPRRKRRIEREVHTMQMMNHPNITRLIEFVETKQYYALVMEYIAGMTLGRFLNMAATDFRRRTGCGVGGGTGLPQEHLFRFFYQLLSALDYCHNCGVAHRDIKLENILIDEATGTIKLTDFGLANLMADKMLMETSCGSPHYASPEILKGLKYHGAVSDVWSLGVVLFALYSGMLPFLERSIPKIAELVCAGAYVFPLHFDIPLRDLIRRMLHVPPNSRITLSQVKAHPWWLENCQQLGLDPNGITGLKPEGLDARKKGRGGSSNGGSTTSGWSSASSASSCSSNVMEISSGDDWTGNSGPGGVTESSGGESDPLELAIDVHVVGGLSPRVSAATSTVTRSDTHDTSTFGISASPTTATSIPTVSTLMAALTTSPTTIATPTAAAAALASTALTTPNAYNGIAGTAHQTGGNGMQPLSITVVPLAETNGPAAAILQQQQQPSPLALSRKPAVFFQKNFASPKKCSSKTSLVMPRPNSPTASMTASTPSIVPQVGVVTLGSASPRHFANRSSTDHSSQPLPSPRTSQKRTLPSFMSFFARICGKASAD